MQFLEISETFLMSALPPGTNNHLLVPFHFLKHISHFLSFFLTNLRHVFLSDLIRIFPSFLVKFFNISFTFFAFVVFLSFLLLLLDETVVSTVVVLLPIFPSLFDEHLLCGLPLVVFVLYGITVSLLMPLHLLKI